MARVNNVMRASATIAAVLALSACGVLGGKDKPKTPVIGKRTSILTREAALEPDASLADVQVVLPPQAVNADWAQSGGSASKAMGHLGLSATPRRAWTASISGSSPKARLAAPPVVAAGKLYVIDTDGKVHAFDAGTGSRLWTQSIKDDKEKGNSKALFGGGVSVEGDRVFADDGLGDVVALNAADGKVIWKVRPGGPLRGSPTLDNGNVYVTSQDNQIFALNQSDGAVQWTMSGTLQVTGVFGVAAPAAGQGSVVAGYSSGELTAYRYENGRTLWADALARTSIATSVATLSDIDADPVIDRGRVFAVGQGGRMASYELVTGQRIWEINVAGIATPWVAGEWVFVVTDDAQLMAIARGTGRIRWMSQLRRWKDKKDKKGPVSWKGPVLAGDRLIVVSSLGEVAYVNPADGTVQASDRAGDRFSLSPVVAQNMLYLLDDGGKLIAMK